MSFFERLPIPRRLNSQLWLFALPSALISFEKRRGFPKLPIGKGRFAGIPLILAGIGLILWADQQKQRGGTINYEGVFAHLAQNPAKAGGLLGLVGVALLTQSSVLAAYSVGLALATEAEQIEIEEPDLERFIPGNR